MANLDPSQSFQDFDNQSVYERCEAAIQKAETLNMVIEFDNANARVALDVKNVELKVREPLHQKWLQCIRSCLHLY